MEANTGKFNPKILNSTNLKDLFQENGLDIPSDNDPIDLMLIEEKSMVLVLWRSLGIIGINLDTDDGILQFSKFEDCDTYAPNTFQGRLGPTLDALMIIQRNSIHSVSVDTFEIDLIYRFDKQLSTLNSVQVLEGGRILCGFSSHLTVLDLSSKKEIFKYEIEEAPILFNCDLRPIFSRVINAEICELDIKKRTSNELTFAGIDYTSFGNVLKRFSHLGMLGIIDLEKFKYSELNLETKEAVHLKIALKKKCVYDMIPITDTFFVCIEVGAKENEIFLLKKKIGRLSIEIDCHIRPFLTERLIGDGKWIKISNTRILLRHGYKLLLINLFD